MMNEKILMHPSIANYFMSYFDKTYLNYALNGNLNYIDFMQNAFQNDRNNFQVMWRMGGIVRDSWGQEKIVYPEKEPEMVNLNQFLNNYFPLLNIDNIVELKKYSYINIEDDTDDEGSIIYYHVKKISTLKVAQYLSKTIYPNDLRNTDIFEMIHEHSQIVPFLDHQSYEKFILKKYLNQFLSINSLSIHKGKI